MAVRAREAVVADIEIRDGRISRIAANGSIARKEDAVAFDASGLLILPGLINAHDHLEFALFPCLGDGPYPNARVWAEEIYHPDRSPIQEQLAVPKSERLIWGGIRNLLSGVTTVAHHNPYEAEFETDFPVRVVRRYGWAHSPALSPDLRERLDATAEDDPFLVHLGEGTDAESREEVYRLDELGALGSRTVLIHAVALGRDEWKLVESRGASIVCCPSSNRFLLGRTVDGGLWNSSIPVALGTDSSLTNANGLLDELRVARLETGLSPERLYEMVTSRPADILWLRDGEGALSEGGVADLFLIPDRGEDPCDSLLEASSSDIRMVLLAGEVKLIAGDDVARASDSGPLSLSAFDVAGRRVIVSARDLPQEPVNLPGFGEISPAPRAS